MGQYSIKLYRRDFGEIYKLPLTIRPLRYRKSVFGGCMDAELLVEASPSNRWLLLDILRCPIEIYYQADLVWWGYVSKTVVDCGKYAVYANLTSMANKVAVTYSTIDPSSGVEVGTRATTTWYNDAESQAKYGVKELMVSAGGMTPTQATTAAQTLLRYLSKPLTGVEFGNDGESKIFAKGWVDTLDWRYYTQTATNSVDNTSVIAEIVSAVGQYIAGVRIVDTSGITGSRYRDGTQTALAEIMRLIEQGTSDYARLVFDITPSRILQVTRDKEVYYSNVDMIISHDGGVKSRFGDPLELYRAPVGLAILEEVYKQYNTPPADIADPRYIRIDEAEYSVDMGYTPVPQGAVGAYNIIQRIVRG